MSQVRNLSSTSRYKQDANIIIALPIRLYFKHFKVIGLEPIIDNFPFLLLSELLFASFLTFYKYYSWFLKFFQIFNWQKTSVPPRYSISQRWRVTVTLRSLYMRLLVKTSTPREGNLICTLELRGFEPLLLCVQSRCVSNYAIAPRLAAVAIRHSYPLIQQRTEEL